MRRFASVGLLLSLFVPTLAGAQVSGTVQSIGLGGFFRPDCWTPMVVVVWPNTARTDTYQLRVKVQDMDRDLAVFSRTLVITGAAGGQERQQKFRTYFMPPPTDSGLPDARDPEALNRLRDKLRVSLYTSQGKWVCDLPIAAAPTNIDPNPAVLSQRRGCKLILAVSEGRSLPIYGDPSGGDLLGVLEDAAFVTVSPQDLPENVIGYDAVDAVVWMDAEPASNEQLGALASYVRQGGRLVICQPALWQKTLSLGELLPVKIEGVEPTDNLEPLKWLWQPTEEALADVKPPIQLARAKAKTGAVVGQWITWKTAKERTPFLVRRLYGAGSVTWIAIDLGDQTLSRIRSGWVHVWNRVFDWKNSPVIVNSQTSEQDVRAYEPGFPMDLGKSLLERWMDLQAKSAALVGLAMLFFIGYWLIAGPGVWAYLAAKGQTHLSWLAFGLCALVATGLTVLVVRLVLRGPPQLKHFSVVRIAPHEPAQLASRIGLYIPRDGMQKIELQKTETAAKGWITALPIHPVYLKSVPDQTGAQYVVSLDEPTGTSAAAISVPYRSTLKKFLARWSGDLPLALEGSARLAIRGWIEGSLTNTTGRQLRNVYLAFNYPGAGAFAGDWILYLPAWEAGVTLDLAREFNHAADGRDLPAGFSENNRHDGTRKIRGRISIDWQPLWLSNMRGSLMGEGTFDDTSSPLRQSLVMLSLFDRLSPARNRPDQRASRVELLRRGGRWLDLSGALSAGALVVLAEAEGELPMPLSVEGDRISGQGLILYQFVLPLDRSELAAVGLD